MDLFRRHPGFYLLLAMLLVAGSVAAAGQQGAVRGTATALETATASGDRSGGVFATPLNVVALANVLGWEAPPSPTGAAESGGRTLGGLSPSEWAASGQGTGDAGRRATCPVTLGSVQAARSDRPAPELSRLCVYRL